MTLRHEKCEDRFAQLEPASLDAIITDPPFNISELAKGEHVLGGFEDRRGFRRDMGEWDSGYSPLFLVEQAARTIKPGGWLIVKNSDRGIGMLRDFASGDHSTTLAYLEWFHKLGLLTQPLSRIKSMFHTMRDSLARHFEYKGTITWRRTNPPTRIRKTTVASSIEWIQVAKRLDNDGNSVEAVAWNFLSQKSMHNYFQTPLCGAPERLYWHLIHDGFVNLDGVIPCHDPRRCSTCAIFKHIPEKDRTIYQQRRRHPTQTPLRVWKWLFDRYAKPGLRVYDPYAGTGSSVVQGRHMGLDIFGSEAEWEYATVGNMWLKGKWDLPQERQDIKQLEPF